MKPSPVVLELLDRERLSADLARPFHPDANEIEVLLATGKRQTFALADVCLVLLDTRPDWAPAAHGRTRPEEVETVAGGTYQASIPDNQDFQTGFYATLLDDTRPHRHAFFPFIGIRSRRLYTKLGEILEKNGAISPDHVHQAVTDQRRDRERRFGEFLAERHQVPQQTIERTLREMLKGKQVPPRAKIGDILISAGLITKEQVEETLAVQRRSKNRHLGELLIERQLVTEDQILVALTTKFRMRFVNLDGMTPSPKALSSISREVARQLHVLPLEDPGDRLIVATCDPAAHAAIGDALRFHAQRRVELVVANSKQIGLLLDAYFPKDEDRVNEIIGEFGDAEVAIEEEVDDSTIKESDSKIIRLLNQFLIEGYRNKASDIHLEPGSGKDPVILRYRIDGLCRVAHSIPKVYSRALVSRIKILANLDIAEHRKPQSGKIIIRYDSRKIEYRVEITPTVGGQEDAVLRILTSAKPKPLDQMDFSPENLEKFRALIANPYGLILCVGPTGAGKTTTLHSALAALNHPDRKIWTAEDPVEITQAGLRQVQVNPKIGFTFAEAMRSFLRADPDVIMIGEMRDRETAKTALDASLTGHLVLSTLHTNTAPETIVRLIEMGLEPLHFADVFLGILAQRLARRLCAACRESYRPSQEDLDSLVQAYGPEFFALHALPADLNALILYREAGCDQCEGSGFAGRIPIHELLVGTAHVKNAIRKNLRSDEIRRVGLDEGMRTLAMDGVVKILAGQTTFGMMSRVVAQG